MPVSVGLPKEAKSAMVLNGLDFLSDLLPRLSSYTENGEFTAYGSNLDSHDVVVKESVFVIDCLIVMIMPEIPSFERYLQGQIVQIVGQSIAF